MLKKISKLLLLLLILGGFFITNNFVVASKSKVEKQLDNIKEEISEKQEEINNLDGKIKIYEENVRKKQEEEITLKNQLETIENNISKTGTEIQKTETEISKLESEMKLVKTSIEETEGDINNKEDIVSDYILDIYQMEQKTNLEILLTNNTFSDYFSKIQYSENLQEKFQTTLNQLISLKDKLKIERKELEETKTEKSQQKKNLSSEKETLKGERIFKDDLLEQTEEDEEKFQELIKKVKKEQTTTNSEINTLESQMRIKIDDLQKKESNGNGAGENDFIMPDNFKPMWPVSSRRITATFHDPTYPFRSSFEHDAIDIGISQGSAIYAADSGVVAIARSDGSIAYSYIMIIHADGFSTIYGHTSEVYVEPDQRIQKGQIIGLSGGMPKTPGAGYYTTGSHLHFGVRLNGVPVNPLNYLP